MAPLFYAAREGATEKPVKLITGIFSLSDELVVAGKIRIGAESRKQKIVVRR